MSYGYANQPATRGKLILKTSAGDLEVELWPKEAPKACRNFVQLCLEGYYDNCPIHRIVRNFIVQSGDPTGTGFGGESIYGREFEDEFHSRIRFSQRGLLAMANTGRDTNKSQFFFTLDKTPELNGKNTIFGKIVGDTLFNLLKLGELETDREERPRYDARIIMTEVLSNPFDDIVPRTTREEKFKLEQEKKQLAEEEELKRKPKGTKKTTLLSFGVDEEVTSDIPSQKYKSSHDLLESEVLKKETVLESAEITSPPRKRKRTSPKPTAQEEEDSDAEYDQKKREQVFSKKLALATEDAKDTSKLSSIQEQIRKLQGEIKQIGAPKKQTAAPKKVDKTSVSKIREEFLSKGKAVQATRKDVKGDVQVKLQSFQKALKESAKSSKHSTKPATTDPQDDWECSLHFIKNCSSCRDTFGENISEDDEDWMNASLHFPKEVGANVYEPKIDDYTVVDPRQGAKADPFGRDIQILGDIKSRQKVIWTEKSTRQVKSQVDQWIEQPDFLKQ